LCVLEHPSRPIPLVDALAASPNTTSALDPADVTATHFATMMFSHLLHGSARAKAVACQIVPACLSAKADESTLFVPADGAPLASSSAKELEDEEERQTLLQLLTENLSLALLSRSRANTSVRDAREWDRYVVGYLCLLSQWLWEDPSSVGGFLDAGGLGVVSIRITSLIACAGPHTYLLARRTYQPNIRVKFSCSRALCLHARYLL